MRVPLADQVDGAALAGTDLAVGTAGQVHRRRVAGPQAHRTVQLVLGEQVPEAEHHVLEVGDPDQVPGAARVGQPGVHPGLHVDVLVPGPGLLDDVVALDPGAEMVGEDPGQPRLLDGPRGSDDRTQAAPGEPPDVGELGSEVAVPRRPYGHDPGDRAVRGPADLSNHRDPPQVWEADSGTGRLAREFVSPRTARSDRRRSPRAGRERPARREGPGTRASARRCPASRAATRPATSGNAATESSTSPARLAGPRAGAVRRSSRPAGNLRIPREPVTDAVGNPAPAPPHDASDVGLRRRSRGHSADPPRPSSSDPCKLSRARQGAARRTCPRPRPASSPGRPRRRCGRGPVRRPSASPILAVSSSGTPSRTGRR